MTCDFGVCWFRTNGVFYGFLGLGLGWVCGFSGSRVVISIWCFNVRRFWCCVLAVALWLGF